MISMDDLVDMVITEAHDGPDAGCIDYASPDDVARQHMAECAGAVRSRVNTSELTPEEIVYARDADVLVVDSDGLGTVPRDWLERFRAAVKRYDQKWTES